MAAPKPDTAADRFALQLELERMILRDLPYGRADSEKVWDLLSPADFHSDAHGRIYAAWRGLAQDHEPLDWAHLMLRLDGEIDSCGGPTGIMNALLPGNLLEPDTPLGYSKHSVLTLARALKEVGRVRRAGKIAQRIADNPAKLAELLPQLEAEVGARKPAESWTSAAYSEADFALREYPKPVNLLGDGLLAKGDLGILYGKPKLGKSWLALTLARAVATGNPWLGIAGPTEAARVCFVSLEIKALRLQQRLTQARGASPATGNLFLLARPDLKGPVDFLNDGTYAQVSAFCTGLKLDLIILDATARTHTADENDGQAMAELLARCDRIGLETGCAVLLIHHERKSDPKAGGKEDDLDALRGSSRFLSDPTLLMRLKRKGGLLQLVCAGANNGPEFDPVWLAPGKHGPPSVVEGPMEKAERNKNMVMLALAELGEASVDELAAKTGMAGRTVRDHLLRGGAERMGGSKNTRYRIPASGESNGEARRNNDNSLWNNVDEHAK